MTTTKIDLSIFFDTMQLRYDQTISVALNVDDPVDIYEWSPHNGYIKRSWSRTKPKIDISVNRLNDIYNILTFSAATLHRLTKITGYDYMADGCYMLEHKSFWDVTYREILRRSVDPTFKRQLCFLENLIPKHWSLDQQIFENIEDLRKKYIDMFTIEYICGIGIPLTEAIMKISDITIVCH